MAVSLPLRVAVAGAVDDDPVAGEFREDILRARTEEAAEGIHDTATEMPEKTGESASAQEPGPGSSAVTGPRGMEAGVDDQNVDTTQSESTTVNDSGNPSASDTTASGANAAASPGELTFNIWEYRVEDNRLLGRGDVERAVYPYLGPDKTIDTVEEARKALEAAYRLNGYGTVFVNIPEQDVDNGVVTLQVFEGTIERIKISGSRYYSLGKIREQVPALEEGGTPHLPTVQEQLADLNKGVAGRTVTPVMKAGKTPGKVDVELKVKDEFPLHGSLELNDRYTADTTRLRLNANIRYDNLWQKSHSASLGYVVAPQDRSEVEVVFGTYLLRFPGSNNLVALYAVDSSSDVATTGDINQVGAGNIYGARAIFPLKNFRSFTHNLTLGADYKDFKETTRLLGVDALNSPASYLSFITSWSGNWFHENGRTGVNAEAHIAPRGLGNTNKEFENKRFGAKPNFAFLQAGLTHERGWLYDTVLKLRVNGQVSDSPLISNEQFSAGGVDTVRGYLESQQLADDGVIGSLELHSPSIAGYIADFLNDMHFFAFVDGARLKLQQPLPDQIDRFTLASIGLGMQLTAWDGLSADLLWAVALSDNDEIESGDARFHFNVGYEF